jgi:hypothetical protein
MVAKVLARRLHWDLEAKLRSNVIVVRTCSVRRSPARRAHAPA